MKQKLFNWLVMKQSEMANKKHPHICKSCEEISSPTKRLSILNLLAWLVLGIVAGIVVWMFTNIPIGLVFGFITTVTLTVINSKIIKPACAKCFSTDIEYIGWTEVLRFRKEKEESIAATTLKEAEKEEEENREKEA